MFAISDASVHELDLEVQKHGSTGWKGTHAHRTDLTRHSPPAIPATHLVLAHSDLFPLDGLHVQCVLLVALALFLVITFLAFGRLDYSRTLARACRDPPPTASTSTAPTAPGQIQRAAVATVGVERAALAAIGLLRNGTGVDRGRAGVRREAT